MVECMKSERFEDSIARVIKHFEGWERYIEIACNGNGEFRSLCEEYALCARCLENWQASDAVVSVQRRKEYTELLAELRQEIHNCLEQRYVRDQSGNITDRGPHTS